MAKTQAPVIPKNLKELTSLVQKCDKKYGSGHVNLYHSDGGTEGIWAVPIDEESHLKIKSDSSSGEFAWVRLVNMPLGWDGTTWGGLVKAKTNGSSRPIAKLEDQKDEIIKKDRLALAGILQKHRAQEAKKKVKST